MSDYRELIERLRDPDNCNVLDDVEESADAIESMQAQMPKRGKWVKCEAAEYAWCCSECGHGYTDNKLTYCYDCGAKMEA